MPDLLPRGRRRRPDGSLELPRPARGPPPAHARARPPPVGDDDWLETLREGDKLRWGRWTAPFETVRRYLVTGQVDAGRNRQLAHDMIVTAMTQLRRWGTDGGILGDQPEWAAARTAVSELMERYADGRR